MYKMLWSKILKKKYLILLTLNAKINEVKNKISNTIKLVTTTALTDVENKVQDYDKHITNPEFNKLRAENYTARLKQTNLATKGNIAYFVKKTDFDDKQRNLNRKAPQINQNIYYLKMNFKKFKNMIQFFLLVKATFSVVY